MATKGVDLPDLGTRMDGVKMIPTIFGEQFNISFE